MTAFTARVLFASYLFFFPAVGILVAYVGFCDPDTCWHLALGQYTYLHGALPQTDPFSTNIQELVLVTRGHPFIQHEWLSDLIFYSVFEQLKAVGLLTLTATLSICSFVVLPAVLMLRHRVPRSASIVCIALVLFASAFRLWVRPEAFSFICMSSLILLNELGQEGVFKKSIICYALSFLLMALWANFHALFVLGIAYLDGYLLAVCTESLLFGKSTKAIGHALTILAAALLGTLATPWHVNYWLYILRFVNSPISHMNKENGGLSWADLAHPTFAPIPLLLVLFVVLCLYGRKKKRSALFLPIALAAGSALLIVLLRRATPFALLIFMSALAKIFAPVDYENLPLSAENARDLSPPSPGAGSSFWEKIDIFLQDLQALEVKTNICGLAVCIVATILSASYLVPPLIPSPSRLFKPPYGAIEYLSKQRPTGRLLNDAKFGSMLTWTLKNPPDLFIDGRFESYKTKVFYDYQSIRQCSGKWRELLERYKIAWVFFPADAPIVLSLEKERGWQVVYRDSTCVILTRQDSPQAAPNKPGSGVGSI